MQQLEIHHTQEVQHIMNTESATTQMDATTNKNEITSEVEIIKVERRVHRKEKPSRDGLLLDEHMHFGVQPLIRVELLAMQGQEEEEEQSSAKEKNCAERNVQLEGSLGPSEPHHGQEVHLGSGYPCFGRFYLDGCTPSERIHYPPSIHALAWRGAPVELGEEWALWVSSLPLECNSLAYWTIISGRTKGEELICSSRLQ